MKGGGQLDSKLIRALIGEDAYGTGPVHTFYKNIELLILNFLESI